MTDEWSGIEVTEVKDRFVPPAERLYTFTVTRCLGPDDGGFYVEARGPRGDTVATVYGKVTAETVIGARFYRK